MFFSGFTLTRLTFLYVKHYLSFIYAYCSSQAYLQYLIGLLVQVISHHRYRNILPDEGLCIIIIIYLFSKMETYS